MEQKIQGVVQKVEYTMNGAGNQVTTIDGVDYATFWDMNTRDWSIGDTVEFTSTMRALWDGSPKIPHADGIRKLENPWAFEYQLLGRLQQDCEYYLGAGSRNKKHLWALDEVLQIQKMKELYEGLPVKPEWITLDEINAYEEKIKPTDDVAESSDSRIN